MSYMSFLIWFPAAICSGIWGINGQPPEVWEKCSVIYAEVIGIENLGAHEPNIKLKALVTLTGPLDSAFEDTLSAVVVIGDRRLSDINACPAKGAKVIVLVVQSNGSWRKSAIPNGSSALFPINDRKLAPCLFEVSGFDDPKVTETIENLPGCAASSAEEAEKAAAEKALPEKQPAPPPRR